MKSAPTWTWISLCVVCLAALPGVAVRAATFTVTTTNDSGAGSLRAAIDSVNAGGSGPHEIRFAIAPFDGTAKTIVLASALNPVVNPVVIDGYTQDTARTNSLANGNDALLLIELTSTNLVANVLTITAGGSTVRGLVFNGFANAIFLQIGGGNRIEGNFIGTTPAGTSAAVRKNTVGVTLTSTNNTIGGASSGARNVVSGNNGIGIHIAGAGASNNVVLGNFIGVDITGTNAVGNAGDGVAIRFSAASNIVGGATLPARNVIAANGQHGVLLGGPRNAAVGNLIGVNVTGALALGNGSDGVYIEGSSNTVGGATVSSRNIISGNVVRGVEIAAGQHNVIQGNFIGTDITGSFALANGVGGVFISDASNIVGGVTATAGVPPGNVLSGNLFNGVQINQTNAVANVVQGNLIGTDATGTLPLANNNFGVIVTMAPSNTIGGINAGEGNVISGNGGGGVRVDDHACRGTVIQGNRIGTDITGQEDVGNNGAGVLLGTGFAVGPRSITVGGDAGNVIAFNTGQGVFAAFGSNNLISANQIFANGALGIDVQTAGVTANDACDADMGANHSQNCPVLSAATTNVAGVVIQGLLDSAPGTTFRVEFFASDACDPSGSGEGQVYLGVTNLMTGANCTNIFTATFTNKLAIGAVVTATATDPAGNTSEFSPCVPVTGPSQPPMADFSGTPTSGVAPLTVTFTDTSTGTITNRFWDFGDGATTNITVAGVSHTYTNAGSYSVSLTVFSPPGSNSQVRASYIVVTNGAVPPSANFAGLPTNGLAPLTVTFTDASTGTITNRFWDFGDGATTNITMAGISHTYTNAGTFNVGLTVFGPGGGNNQTRTNYIVVTNAPPDSTPPTLLVASPMDFEVFTNADITIAGTATDDSGISTVTVNGAAATLAAGTNWSKDLTLAEGTNVITVIAFDNSAAMNAATQSVHAIFVPPQPGPDTNAPTVPAAVQAVALSCTNVLVSWAASTDSGGSGLAGYLVYRDGVFLMILASTSHLDDPVSSTSNHCYAVSAIDNAGNESAPSTPACVETPSCPECDLAEALDTQTTTHVWSNATWECQIETTHDGVDAVSSGILPDGGTNRFQTSVNGPGTLTFWWKVSSETNFDVLSFSVDGAEVSAISGEVDWMRKTVLVTNGAHSLTWQYSKSEAGSEAMDAGFVDQVTWEEGAPSPLEAPSQKVKAKCKNDVCALKGKFTLFNPTGAEITPSSLRLYLSTDVALDDGDELLSEQFPSVQAGKKRKVALNTSLPAGMDPGGSFILVVLVEGVEEKIIAVHGPLP